ncbi:MAG: TolC family protein [Gemmatimonadota bacterium]
MSAHPSSVARCVAVVIAAVVVAASAVGAATPLMAQQLPAVLTLEDALALAREYSPVYQRTTNDLDVASASVRSAWGAFLPSLSTSLSFGGSSSRRIIAEDEFGEVIERPQSSTFRSSSASQGISSSLTLFDAAMWRRPAEQRALYAATEAAVDATAVQVTAQVSRAFYQAVRATRDIALEEQLLASARERLERTEELMRLAARNRVDLLGAQEDVLIAEQNLARVRGEADKVRLALSTAIGIEPPSALALDTVLPAVFDPAALDVDQLVARALASSPTVLQRQAALRAAGHRRSAAGASRLPTISASAGYSRSVSAQDFGAIGDIDLPNSGLSFGFGVSLPLFSRFQTAAAIEQADAAADDAAHDLRLARLTAEQQVRSAVIDVTNAYRALQLAEERAALSRERLELTLERYGLGGGSFTELQAVIDRTSQAEREALNARFAFLLARIDLEEILGSRLEL